MLRIRDPSSDRLSVIPVKGGVMEKRSRIGHTLLNRMGECSFIGIDCERERVIRAFLSAKSRVETKWPRTERGSCSLYLDPSGRV